jgi:hypothetical protein
MKLVSLKTQRKEIIKLRKEILQMKEEKAALTRRKESKSKPHRSDNIKEYYAMLNVKTNFETKLNKVTKIITDHCTPKLLEYLSAEIRTGDGYRVLEKLKAYFTKDNVNTIAYLRMLLGSLAYNKREGRDPLEKLIRTLEVLCKVYSSIGIY